MHAMTAFCGSLPVPSTGRGEPFIQLLKQSHNNFECLIPSVDCPQCEVPG